MTCINVHIILASILNGLSEYVSQTRVLLIQRLKQAIKATGMICNALTVNLVQTKEASCSCLMPEERYCQTCHA